MSQEKKVKLSQWDALMVEGLRRLGWSNDEIVERVSRGTDLPSDDSIYEFHFEELAAFAAREPETFKKAVREGYQIKYNTIGGIRSWIDVAIGKEPEVNREPGQEAVTAELTSAEKERLAGVLSYGWTIAPATGESAGTNASRYRIEPTRG